MSPKKTFYQSREESIMHKKAKPLRNVIKDRLIRLDKSIGWLSRETGLDRNELGKIIRGVHNPQLATAKKIAKALTCLIDDLWYLQ